VPEDAPAVLLERYGAERGFAHEAGSTGGVVVVGIPVEAAVGKIREATAGYAALYGGGMIIFFALIQGFFNRLVVHNLHRLTHKFRSLFHDEPELGDMEKLTQGDEIEEVVQGLEELGDYLHDVNSRLRQHTGNLEQMVRERTSELEAEAGERRADVELFVQLLDGLNKSHSRRDLWLHALPLIVERFHAREASLVCLLASQTFYNWPLGTDDPKLPENWRAIIGECRPEWDEHRAFIPVGASDASTEGILCLTWDEGTRIKEQDKNVLRALGQQLGIAMENLSALHNLLRHKGMLQAIVEGIRDPVLLMDGACRVVLANEAARTLAGSFGGSASELSCSGLFAPGGVLDGCPLERALIRGEPVSREVETGDGRLFVINVFPVAEGTAQEGRGVVYIRDVTQEKRMIESMQQSERLATVGQLAAGLAHEMNNPLGVIKCYAELLKGAEPGQDILPDAEVILKHASQAQNVLQDLLNFARPKQAVQAPLDLRAAVRGAMSVFRFQAEKKGVRVERELPADLPPVMANEQSVEQIMANLLKNALDAVPEQGGRIRVQLRHLEAEEAIEIRVADNGSGVRDEDVKKLFDPFYTTKEVGEGTGLGLAIVYGLVQEMGGTIDIENDGGAVFVVVIPVVNPRFGGQP
jgi:signal transduction histidine kinase